MTLTANTDPRISALESVATLTATPWFSAMIVIRDQHILFERYAPDFNTGSVHSIQSITKTLVNLMAGRLRDSGVLDLSRHVAHYIPEIGSGYARATIQEVLNMDVINEYSEDFSDPSSMYFAHEEAMGWRLPASLAHELTQHRFLPEIKSLDITNRNGFVSYKDANTAVLGWVIERASGRPLREFLADIVDAAGLEEALYITTDRSGVPTLEGGVSLTVRDLARYFSIFARGGIGVRGEVVGSGSFIEETLRSGVPMPHPHLNTQYSNHLMVSGSYFGHGGWGGQYVIANKKTGVVAAFLSAIDTPHGSLEGYLAPLVNMMRAVTSLASA